MNNENQKCNLCDKECPVNNLQCHKGRRYFENMNKENDYNVQGQKEQFDQQEIGNQRGTSDQQERNRQHEGYGHHGHHGYHGHQDRRRPDDLHKHCGHNAHHRDGWKEEMDDWEKGELSSESDAGDWEENGILALLERCGRCLHHREGGNRGQGRILKILAENQEINQKDLQDRLGIQSGSISEIVIKLEAKGFLKRIKDEADKRMTRLELTEEGKKKADEIGQRAGQTDDKLLQSLTAEEQETLTALLSKLLSGWKEIYGNEQFTRGNHKGCGHRRQRQHFGNKEH